MILPKMGLGSTPSSTAMGYYLLVWGIFSFFLFIVTLKMNKAMQLVFGTLVLLFALLAIADFTGSSTLKTIAGVEGVICGIIAIYTSMAQLYEDAFGRVVLPVG